MSYTTSNVRVRLCKWRRLIKSSGLVLILLPGLSMAEMLNLKQAKLLMLERNPALESYKFKQQILTAKTQTAALKPEMSLGFELENFAGSSPYQNLSQSEYSVSLSSLYETKSKRDARLSLLSAEQKKAAIDNESVINDLMISLTREYITAVAIQERKGLAVESLALSEEMYQSVKKRAALGAISEAEVKRTYAAFKQASIEVNELNQKHKVHMRKLSAFWNYEDSGFNSVSGNLFQFGQLPDLNYLTKNIKNSLQNKLLLADQAVLESKVTQVKSLSEKALTWSLGVRRLEESNDTALMAGISMPLFKSKRNQGEVQAVSAELNDTVLQQQVYQLTASEQLNEVYGLRQIGIDRFNGLKADIIPALTEALTITQKAYLDGRYSYLEYISAKQELLTAQKTLIDTAEAVLIYGVDIELITGEPLIIEGLSNLSNTKLNTTVSKEKGAGQ